MRPHHCLRRMAIKAIEQPFFNPIILTTIMCNCTTMAWSSPLDPPGTWKEAFITRCENIFLTIFVVELLLKVLAYGFVMHSHSYLRDPWCQLDFVVVTLAVLPILCARTDPQSAERLPTLAECSRAQPPPSIAHMRTLTARAACVHVSAAFLTCSST